MGWESPEAGEGPLTDRAIARLRCAAALLPLIPKLRARIHAGEQTLFEVRQPPVIEPVEHLVLSPCAFRSMVVQAHEGRKHDKRLMFRGLPPVAEPLVELIPGPGDMILPGSLLRCRSGGAWWHGIAIAMPRGTVRQALIGASFTMGICLYPDYALDVTLLCRPVASRTPEASERAIDTLLDAVARCSVWELIDHVDARAPNLPRLP